MMTAEEEEVRDYCLRRPLTRPKTNWQMLLWRCLLYLTITVSLFLLLRYVIQLMKWDYTVSPTFLVYLFLLVLLADGRRLGILLVELYQHYAPEELRRRCVCKPTCSEYAILVLQAYSLPRAVYLIVRRLKYGCGGHYHTDYP